MNERYDLLVVGAGPAGLMSSIVAAKEGLKVLLVERKEEVSRITRSCCSMWINEPMTHGECISVEEGKVVFRLNDFALEYTGKNIPLRQYIRLSPRGKRLVFENTMDPVAIAFDKAALLQGLFIRAKSCGVSIAAGTMCTGVKEKGDRVSLTLRRSKEEWIEEGSYLIIADGVNSALGERCGFHRGRTYLGRFQVLSCFFEGVECPYPPAFMSFVGRGHLKGGLGNIYMLPKPWRSEDEKGVYEVTIGSPEGDSLSLMDKMVYFTQRGYFCSWFKQAKCIYTTCAILDFRTPVVTPVRERILMVGDAAAFIETYVQGAIIYGRSAALAVSEAVKTGKDFSEYIAHWQKTYGYNQPGEIEKATQAYGLNRLTDEELDYVFSLTDNERYRGYVNEFNDFERVMKVLFSHLPRISREKPELAQKLKQHFHFQNTRLKENLQLTGE